MKRAILEVIVSGVASTPEQVEKYASCTLLSVAMESTTGSFFFVYFIILGLQISCSIAAKALTEKGTA